VTDPYLDLTDGALHNRLGITDPDELRRVEAEATALRMIELRREPLPGRYDLDHLQDIHWYLFQDIYAWAGELRTVTLGRGQMFCRPEDLPDTADAIFADLHGRDHLRDRAPEHFLDGLTALLAALNRLHPFREGNGRTQRTFLQQLAAQAGHQLRWTAMDPEQNVLACRAAFDGDTNPLRELLAPLIRHSEEAPPASSQRGGRP
jgi:cell filamentation protein